MSQVTVVNFRLIYQNLLVTAKPEAKTEALTPWGTHRVGGGVASPVLSHHRAYGSVPRRFMRHIEAFAADFAAT